MYFFSDQSGEISLNQSLVMLGKEVIVGLRETIGHEEAFVLCSVHFYATGFVVLDF